MLWLLPVTPLVFWTRSTPSSRQFTCTRLKRLSIHEATDGNSRIYDIEDKIRECKHAWLRFIGRHGGLHRDTFAQLLLPRFLQALVFTNHEMTSERYLAPFCCAAAGADAGSLEHTNLSTNDMVYSFPSRLHRHVKISPDSSIPAHIGNYCFWIA